MTAYRFRMATLLKIREATRDERRGQLAEAYRADEVLDERMAMVQQHTDALRNAYRRAIGPGVVEVDGLIESQRYELILKGQAEQIRHQKSLLAAEIERRRFALLEADREVRVLEKLREHKLEEHRQEENRKEIRLLDEVAHRNASQEDER